MKIRAKIIGLIVISVLVSIFIGYVGLRQINNINNILIQIKEVFNPLEENIAYMEIALINQEMHMEQYFLHASSESSNEFENKFKDVGNFFNDGKFFNEKLKAVETILQKGISGPITEEETKKLLREVLNNVKQIEKSHMEYQRVVEERIFSAVGDINETEKNAAQAQVGDIRLKLSDLLNKIVKVRDNKVNEAENLKNNAYKVILVVSIIASIFLVAIGVVIGVGIRVRIAKMVNMLREIAQGKGDLTRKININANDEIGEMAEWFNQFISKLREIIVDVKQTSGIVLSASQQLSTAVEESNNAMSSISTSVTEIATRMQENASAVEETTASIEEVAGSAESVARTSQQAVEDTVHAQRNAEKGNEAVNEIIKSINEVSQFSIEVRKTISELEVSSNEIGNILDIISGIADQTNLLALNAAIEAARAGEHGRGFAVVAEEIRKLAEQSSASAKEIANLVKGIQQRTVQVVNTVGVQEKKILISVEKARLIEQSIKEILQSINHIVTKVNDIAASSQEQAAATEQMTKSMDSVSKATDHVAKNAAEISGAVEEQVSTLEEIGAITEEMSAMVKVLNDKVNQFKTE